MRPIVQEMFLDGYRECLMLDCMYCPHRGAQNPNETKGGDEQILALWRLPEIFQNSFADLNFTPPYLSTITARTLIVHGDRDPLYPVNLAVEMFEAIPSSYLWIVPNGGHGPIFGDHAARFVETALTFLNGEWQS